MYETAALQFIFDAMMDVVKKVKVIKALVYVHTSLYTSPSCNILLPNEYSLEQDIEKLIEVAKQFQTEYENEKSKDLSSVKTDDLEEDLNIQILHSSSNSLRQQRKTSGSNVKVAANDGDNFYFRNSTSTKENILTLHSNQHSRTFTPNYNFDRTHPSLTLLRNGNSMILFVIWASVRVHMKLRFGRDIKFQSLDFYIENAEIEHFEIDEFCKPFLLSYFLLSRERIDRFL